jgi:beta-aspartyl-peptidase (threonine type)
MKIVMAKAAADFVATGLDAQAAAEKAVKLLADRASGSGGLIVVDSQGRAGVSFSTPHMSWAAKTARGE